MSHFLIFQTKHDLKYRNSKEVCNYGTHIHISSPNYCALARYLITVFVLYIALLHIMGELLYLNDFAVFIHPDITINSYENNKTT